MDCSRTHEGLLDEVLGGGSNREIEPHLEECYSCRDDALDIARTADQIRGALAPWRTPTAPLEIPRRRRRVPLAIAALVLIGAAAWLAIPKRPSPTPPPATPGWVVFRSDGSGFRIARAEAPPAPPAGPVRWIPSRTDRLQVKNNGRLTVTGTVRCRELTVAASSVRVTGDRLVVEGDVTISSGNVEFRTQEVCFRSMQASGGSATFGHANATVDLVVSSGTTIHLSGNSTYRNLRIERNATLEIGSDANISITNGLINEGTIVAR